LHVVPEEDVNGCVQEVEDGSVEGPRCEWKMLKVWLQDEQNSQGIRTI
jgi:hypothetical protein